MASMNNWLGFSLSPQELPSQPQDHSVSRLGFNSDEISGTDVSGECLDLTSDSTLPSLNLPAPFGILEAFNRNNQSQDWNMKDMSMMNSTDNNSYKTTSDFSMLMVGSSCNNSQNQGGPKLENFLGGHSFADPGHKLSVYDGNGDYMYPNCSLQLPPEEAAATDGRASIGGGGGGGTNNNSNNNTIGLSMIKNWLRNQPTPAAAQPENKNGGGGAAQTLSLSMSNESQTSSPLPLMTASAASSGGGESTSSDNKHQKLDAQTGAIEAVPRKSIDTFGQRTSIYRGVTRHRWTGRYEAHLWDNSCRREGQTRKGRQVYLGGYDKEEKAARAYDLAALKYWGTTTTTNFPISNYEKEIEEMKHMTRQEYVASLRRKSSGFSRGASIYRGVTRHHQHGRWQARIGRVAGNKDLYLGTFSTQEEAAEAYDIAAIKFRGLNAVTNFDMSRYDVKSILESSNLPIGGAAKRLKDAAAAEQQAEILTMDLHHAQQRADNNNNSNHNEDNITSSHLISDGISNYHSCCWPTTVAFQQAQPFNMHYPYGQQRVWCKQEQDADATRTFQDLNQLQLGSTHNFFHQPSSVLHNLMSLDSSSSTMEHSSGSSSAVYGSGAGNGGFHQGVGYGGGSNGGFVMPMATVVIAQEGNNTIQGNGYGDNDEIKAHGYENMFGSTTMDPYQGGRNLYYLSQQQQQQSSAAAADAAGAVLKAASVYDHHQGSACNNWVPTAVPTTSLAPRAQNMHGSLPWISNFHRLE